MKHRQCTYNGRFEDTSLLQESSVSIIGYCREHSMRDKLKIVVVGYEGGTLDVTCCTFQEEEKKIMKQEMLEYFKRVSQVKQFIDLNLGRNNFDDSLIKFILNGIKQIIILKYMLSIIQLDSPFEEIK
ncbi:hypothetical protein EDI_244280 [Entamoeba dispar SAW760]|uniref:Uncharacterized protein n=1 Tax=Entamoeba dispar (strain ATCC PRA-260 / SAW760) TaxID=370354 RepID=B0EAY9_ENTDS|nr:uncharacterized protein EDI_244280 [Entamoeba dispar SAW760]EDR28296.1 hypothetical protein EDI_244280 [Entamoeba dispar SAW760]|eukprot:EDR28296.1 hypothetical protein EDI_244280 [Entamoeba dispar SAW760]